MNNAMSTEVFSVPISNPASGASPINLAKEKLLKGLADLDRQRKSIMDVLSYMEAMERRTGYNLEDAPPIRKDEFRGTRPARALESYLKSRREFRIPLPRIVADLLAGGCDPGGKAMPHVLKIGLGNWTDFCDFQPKEHYKTKNGTDRVKVPEGTKDEDVTVWLLESALQPKRRKRS